MQTKELIRASPRQGPTRSPPAGCGQKPKHFLILILFLAILMSLTIQEQQQQKNLVNDTKNASPRQGPARSPPAAGYGQKLHSHWPRYAAVEDAAGGVAAAAARDQGRSASREPPRCHPEGGPGSLLPLLRLLCCLCGRPGPGPCPRWSSGAPVGALWKAW